jgi:hypothetical protein
MKSLILTACILACTAGTASAQFFAPPTQGSPSVPYPSSGGTCPKGCARCEPSWSAASNKCLQPTNTAPSRSAIDRKARHTLRR